MKRILIVNNNLHIGGVQKSLVNLLNTIHGQYDISLVLFHPTGELLKQIPKDVKLLPIRSGYLFWGMTKYDTAGKPLWLLGRACWAAITRVFGRGVATRLMGLGQKKLTGYDAAISYLHDAGEKVFYGGCNDFVLRHVPNAKKITVLHCDYSLCGANTPQNRKRYEQFDVIAACSDGCAKQFVRCIPELEDKVTTLYNCHDFEGIIRAAEADPRTFSDDCVNIVTVARLGVEKGVLRAVEALGTMTDLHNYHYYIVGDGIQRPQIEARIRALGLENKITLLGEKANPYGYIKAADLLLIPSVSEAAPMVIGEAAALGTPILSTLTSSAKDMIENPGYGWVCENSQAGLRHMLCRILSQPQLLEEKKQNLSRISQNNSLALEQLAQIIQ